MLLRAYRLTDKIGVIILKCAVALTDVTLDGLYVLRRAFLRLVWWGALALWFLLTPFRFLLRLLLRGAGGTAAAATGSMARRAARAQLDANLREDPVLAQNRALNVLTLTLLVALVAVVIWATNPARTNQGVVPLDGELNAALFAGASPVAPTANAGGAGAISAFATPVPTATPRSPLLTAAGTIAYSRRELGQSDIWAIPVDGRAPIRLTNSPRDERDPAWSPNGRQLAYASRQDDGWELYVLDVTNNQTTRVTYDLSFQGAPHWSPDGEYLVYESYQGNNLDVYIVRADGREEAIRLPSNAEAPDFSPAWSPSPGRQIAFVSWRDGNQDIYVFSLDDQSVVNVTNTPTRNEDFPAWSPNGDFIAYSALDEGLEKVFVKSVANPDDPARAVGRGRTPTWSPDGLSVLAAVDSIDGTQFVALPVDNPGVLAPVIQVQSGADSPNWTSAPLPQALVNTGGLPAASSEALYVEQEQRLAIDPPYRLRAINVSTDQPSMSERVDDSFNALRQAVLEAAGWDVLGRLDDAFWSLDRPPSPNESPRSWLKTGRAFAITRADILGDPPPFEIVREDIGVETYWRVYVRVVATAQSGQLGEPLRRMPWDFASRTSGDVEAYDQGGRLKTRMPTGYYIDLTQIAADYGWERLPAGSDWRANINTVNFALFVKSDGLSWYDAMRELYTEGALINFAPTAVPQATLPPQATIIIVTDVPPEQLSTLPPAGESPPDGDGGQG